jgi:hypothetical protein
MIEMSGSSLWRVVFQILPLGAGLFFGSAVTANAQIPRPLRPVYIRCNS